MVAALTNRNIQSQRDRIGERQLDLAVVPAWAEDPQIGNHAMPGADDRYALFRREESVLIQRLVYVKLVTLAEETLEVLLRHVTVARGDVDHELGTPPLPPLRREGEGGCGRE